MDKCVQKITVNCHNCHAFGVCSEIADACEAYLRGELTKEGECATRRYIRGYATIVLKTEPSHYDPALFLLSKVVITSTFVEGFRDPRNSKRPNQSSL